MAKTGSGLSNPNAVLDKLRVQLSEKRRFVAPMLLRDPDSDDAQGWYMSVPTAFNAALDIVMMPRSVDGVPKMTWTQGAWFSFAAGDILYDTAKAYTQWDEALKHIGVCFQVESSRNAALPKDGVKHGGAVRFSVWSPNRVRSRLERRGVLERDQYDFVQLLVNGPDDRVLGLLGG